MIGFGDALEVFGVHVVTGHLFFKSNSLFFQFNFDQISLESTCRGR
jgi:hypothetical protein